MLEIVPDAEMSACWSPTAIRLAIAAIALLPMVCWSAPMTGNNASMTTVCPKVVDAEVRVISGDDASTGSKSNKVVLPLRGMDVYVEYNRKLPGPPGAPVLNEMRGLDREGGEVLVHWDLGLTDVRSTSVKCFYGRDGIAVVEHVFPKSFEQCWVKSEGGKRGSERLIGFCSQ